MLNTRKQGSLGAILETNGSLQCLHIGKFCCNSHRWYILETTLNSEKFKTKSKFLYTLIKEGFSVNLSPKPVVSLSTSISKGKQMELIEIQKKQLFKTDPFHLISFWLLLISRSYIHVYKIFQSMLTLINIKMSYLPFMLF